MKGTNQGRGTANQHKLMISSPTLILSNSSDARACSVPVRPLPGAAHAMDASRVTLGAACTAEEVLNHFIKHQLVLVRRASPQPTLQPSALRALRQTAPDWIAAEWSAESASGRVREHELTPERVLGGVPGGARRGEGLTPDLREAAPHLQEAAPDLQEVTPDLQEDSQWYVSTVLNSEAAPSVETLGVRVCANSTPRTLLIQTPEHTQPSTPACTQPSLLNPCSHCTYE